MDRAIKKLFSIMLCIIISVCMFTGCEKELPVSLPDYSANTDRFEFFTYTSPTDGYYYIDGLEYYSGEDFTSVERYKEMLDCGFTMLYLNRKSAIYNDTVWETSQAKKSFENAYKAGFKKILIVDYRINSIIDTGSTVFDSEKAQNDPAYDKDPTHYSYPSRDALDAKVKEYMSMYASMPGFYGVVLFDEPRMSKAEIYGEVYKSLFRVANEFGINDFYVHSNFLPIGAATSNYGKACTLEHTEENPASECKAGFHSYEQMYRDYMEKFLKETGMGRISADTYAFRGAIGLYPGMYPSIQILREEATKYNAELSYCLQSFHYYNGNQESFRRVDKAMMYMEMNSLVGFGASHFAYYTYMPHPETSVSSGDVGDGSFLTWLGERTNIWYYGQQLMKEMQEFAPVVLSYDFCGSKFYFGDKIQFGVANHLESTTQKETNTTLRWNNDYEFNKLKSVKIDNDIALTTELYDKNNDLYMYMLQNVIDPVKSKIGNTEMSVEADFGEEYSYVAEFDCGKLRYVPLENGVYKNNLSAGYAVYLIPLK